MPKVVATWEICWAQALGGRPDQQDQGGTWLSPDGNVVLAALADGAGGHRQGARAAQSAVAAAKTLWDNKPPTSASPEFLEEASRAAHEAICESGAQATSARATWVAFLGTPTQACWVHSGDSRLYHFAAGQLATRTRDHSVAQVLVDQGKIAPHEIPHHPDRSTLLDSLGGPNYVSVENGSCVLRGDDLFLLCTDGFWNQITDGEMLTLAFQPAMGRQVQIRELVAEAVRRAGVDGDNVSVWCLALRQ